MGQSTLLRRAEPADLPSILALWLEASDWITHTLGIVQWKPGSFHLEGVTEHFRETDMFVAQEGDDIVGSFSVQWADPYIWGELDNDRSGYVHRLVVSRSYGGKGLGRQLLQGAESYIAANGKTHIRLDCMADNAKLNQYYRDCGFVYMGRADRRYFSASLFEKAIVVK